MTTLMDIRVLIEQETGSLSNESVIQWANQVNTDIGVSINLPATAQIAVITTAFEYPEPAGIKVINRLSLQSDKDSGLDREYSGKYRRYNGKLVFPSTFPQADTLNVDYYKQLTYFTDIMQPIELEDRHAPLYVSYGVMKYYKRPDVMQSIGEAQARQEAQMAQAMYMNVRLQVVSLYALNSDPFVIEERW